jgi:hypothetical protein
MKTAVSVTFCLQNNVSQILQEAKHIGLWVRFKASRQSIQRCLRHLPHCLTVPPQTKVTLLLAHVGFLPFTVVFVTGKVYSSNVTNSTQRFLCIFLIYYIDLNLFRTRMIITEFTTSRWRTLPWAILIQFKIFLISSISSLILSYHLLLCLTSCLFPSGFPRRILYPCSTMYESKVQAVQLQFQTLFL